MSAGGASRGLLTTPSNADRRETSPPIAVALSPKVETPLGQQAQSKHRPAQSPKGSSDDAEQASATPRTAGVKQASKSTAKKVTPRRFTQGLITPLGNETPGRTPRRLSHMVARKDLPPAFGQRSTPMSRLSPPSEQSNLSRLRRSLRLQTPAARRPSAPVEKTRQEVGLLVVDVVDFRRVRLVSQRLSGDHRGVRRIPGRSGGSRRRSHLVYQRSKALTGASTPGRSATARR